MLKYLFVEYKMILVFFFEKSYAENENKQL